MLFAGFGLAIFLLMWSLADGAAARRRRAGTPAPPAPVGALPDPPLVAALIPARNEAAVIADAVTSVRAQAGVTLQIRVIDDASQDATAARARAALSGAADGLVVPAGTLPAGWTGKTHALARGVALSDAPWILTLDADVTLAPDAVLRAVAHADRNRLDALSLSPSQASRGAVIDAVQAAAYELLDRLYPFAVTSRPESAQAAASGAFFLMRRTALAAAGGFDAVRHAVVEDLHLARLLRRSGARQAFLPGGDLVRVRMYDSFAAVVQGWTRLLAPLVAESEAGTTVGAEAVRAAGRALAAPWATAMTIAAARSGHGLWATVLGAAVALWVIAHPRGARHAVREPLGFAIVCGLLVRSAVCNRRGGGITWKGRVYAPAG